MKTDNSYFEEKVQLRIDGISSIDHPYVLDAYSGTGRIWDEVERRTGKKIQILRIEKEKNKGDKIYLPGDNLKYLASIDLSLFDVIDLDAYGIPFNQIEILVKRKYSGIVFVTAIQTMQGQLPRGLLLRNGYSEKMIKKIPTLFSKNGADKLKNYLYLRGVQYVKGYFIGRKNYFMFNLNPK